MACSRKRGRGEARLLLLALALALAPHRGDAAAADHLCYMQADSDLDTAAQILTMYPVAQGCPPPKGAAMPIAPAKSPDSVFYVSCDRKLERIGGDILFTRTSADCGEGCWDVSRSQLQQISAAMLMTTCPSGPQQSALEPFADTGMDHDSYYLCEEQLDALSQVVFDLPVADILCNQLDDPAKLGFAGMAASARAKVTQLEAASTSRSTTVLMTKQATPQVDIVRSMESSSSVLSVGQAFLAWMLATVAIGAAVYVQRTRIQAVASKRFSSCGHYQPIPDKSRNGLYGSTLHL